ncbi:hypothetical protein [Paraburkholderia caribensis]|uniref:hypothetical protein n=1 Tax=Paraburkholderia caribensis TaxID=75105 RepID=UPI001CC7E68C|nr:hypothetical protein [Paraburkholderia caribensis]
MNASLDAGTAAQPLAGEVHEQLAPESSHGRHPAHRWLDLAEKKLALIEHDVVAELLDIVRMVRQEL